jgi:hypothetical protein
MMALKPATPKLIDLSGFGLQSEFATARFSDKPSV